ncbi:hypothetical protein PPYR_03907 [Photinus pyralis]|uniref:HTH CENPB-type domain-containing protein n=4 Tax=Photinus pyralis TaxID=7054 RepID=A0A5N4AB87_PHOPY|nr:uncharacterized protein LOC116165140 isoform X1 [Photinus pyralis]XP_031352292.1 uncharacterized protein LOC116177450 isoform X1 [Photinus pyralis]XP_031358834.1 uncharacterized protein LOC116182439 isoform X1 [Photinus pyralis]KAB0790264.1 hypothetical protein PPYR_15402 [Photinus pyralis]KAB0794549.1 hypothetical protein PPYR_11388 [Photinus pyralis]KAB0801721.1 hypothetical protein PPYR_03907 [Photinus pyralis]
MPRNYVRKNVRALWSEEDLRNAIEDLRNGRGSVREVSRTYNVPARTLMRRMSSGNLSKEKLGRKCCLTLVHEASLVKYIQNMEKHGFAITSVDVKKLAFSFATKNNIPHNFNIDKKQAGHDWFVSFMQRHPELSIRKAQGMSIARAQGMNKDECGRYFDLLGKILTENDLVNTPRKIFNIDESGLQLNNNPGKVVATKGAKTVNCVTSGEKGETVSVIACVNAEGHFLPPVCIFKGKKKKPEFEDGLPPGGKVIMNEKSAYVTTDIFKTWLQNHFIARKEPGKVLLILDGHSSHCSDVELLDLASSNDVIMLCLPSHTTHWLQPLDRSFFKPLKTYWSQACNTWIHNHPGRKLTRLQFPTLLNTAWGKAATVQNGISGFRTCGIYPLNATIIPDHAFIQQNPDPIPNNENLEENVNVVIPNDADNNNIAPNDDPNNGVNILDDVAVISKTNNTSFEAIAPIPVIPGPSRCNKRKQHAELLTSPEIIAEKRNKKETKDKKEAEKLKRKQEKERKEANKNKKGTQKTKKKRNTRITDDTSSSESELEVNTVESGDSELEHDESEFCAQCGGYYFDKTGPKCDWLQCVKCHNWVHEICTPSDKHCADCV